jgi:hypothetical protein
LCAVALCGLTAYAAEAEPDAPQTPSPPAVTAIPADPPPTEKPKELYPAEVREFADDGGRQIVKTYILAPGQDPADIPREGFERDGWKYALTDITENRVAGRDAKAHTETVTINTDTNDPNAVIAGLSPTLEYQSEDGFAGTLALDLASVKCEAAGYRNTGYTVSATREYPHLSSADVSLIPKTVTENGRTLTLSDVAWEAQNTVNVDYEDIPDGYRAVAEYTAKASKSVVTGYVTTADYIGEIGKAVTGDTTYTAYFEGREINPSPSPTAGPGSELGGPSPPPVWIIPIAAILALLTGAGTWWFLLRHNVKVYDVKDDGRRTLTAKDRIGAKSMTVDLSPLEGRVFGLEIDRYTAKILNGKTIELLYGPVRLQHKIAYEGNAYNIEADFAGGTIRAVH